MPENRTVTRAKFPLGAWVLPSSIGIAGTRNQILIVIVNLPFLLLVCYVKFYQVRVHSIGYGSSSFLTSIRLVLL
jgi:hypothetical protein